MVQNTIIIMIIMKIILRKLKMLRRLKIILMILRKLLNQLKKENKIFICYKNTIVIRLKYIILILIFCI